MIKLGCFLWWGHDWGRWSEPFRKVIIVEFGLPMHVTARQRTCERCFRVQVRW